MWFLLCCMDYRYPQRVLNAMSRIAPSVPYFQFILAGASLGLGNPAWRKAFIEHVKTAGVLGYNIDHIMILDHRDCGAYRKPREIGVPPDILKEALGPWPNVLPSFEQKSHTDVYYKVARLIRADLGEACKHTNTCAWLLAREQDDKISETDHKYC